MNILDRLRAAAGTRKALVPLVALLSACAASAPPVARDRAAADDEFYGTLEPLASDAIYFVLTDRFVNGDPSNDQRIQGRASGHPTFDIPIAGPDGETDNIGYLGGDFKGVLDNADYIRGMGFGAVWITPITDNPDEAFSGGEPVTWGSMWTDRNKTGYHGYWSDNFYQIDEHWPSTGLDFAAYTRAMRAHGLKTVLDIVANHGGPAWTMPTAQPKFGQLFDSDGRLVADQQNLPPEKLDPRHNPLHAFYKTKPILAQLSNIDETNRAALDYFVGAYDFWIGQGADAFRIDAIGLTPTEYWKKFAARIREKHPGFFMFGENFDYHAKKIAPYTHAEGGSLSVLDFPLRGQIAALVEPVTEKTRGTHFGSLEKTLQLRSRLYRNPYELVTFYDNHDMARLNASDSGFIDANNLLFTLRGIPCVYYGSETGFMRGRAEHAGNRNYFGQQRIDDAPRSTIYQALKRIANLRRDSVALQRGLQLDVEFNGDTAVFYRTYQNAGVAQTALVVLNRGDAARRVEVRRYLQPGRWRNGFGAASVDVADHLDVTVPAHGVEVFLYDAAITRADARAALARLMDARKASRL